MTSAIISILSKGFHRHKTMRILVSLQLYIKLAYKCPVINVERDYCFVKGDFGALIGSLTCLFEDKRGGFLISISIVYVQYYLDLYTNIKNLLFNMGLSKKYTLFSVHFYTFMPTMLKLTLDFETVYFSHINNHNIRRNVKSNLLSVHDTARSEDKEKQTVSKY